MDFFSMFEKYFCCWSFCVSKIVALIVTKVLNKQKNLFQILIYILDFDEKSVRK